MDFKDFDLGDVTSSSPSLDSFFEESSTADSNLFDLDAANLGTSGPDRYRVANVEALSGFQRIASDTLIHKSERDLWSLLKTDDGEWVIERLFDDDGNPLKA